MIDALPEHMKPIVRFALATGCRAGEILGLEWSRVDLVRKVAWLDHGTTKSGEGRGIPLNADAMAALESTFGQHPRWRFTFAGQRVQSGTSLPELMELGGWKWYEMVLRYAHLAPEKLSPVAGRIERQLVTSLTVAPPAENVAANATFSLRSVH